METSAADIRQLLEKQRSFFLSGQTKDVKFRLSCLGKLRQSIKRHENELLEALRKDLNKSPEEAYMTEIAMVYSELRLHSEQLRNWSGDEFKKVPLYLFPGRARIVREPVGCVLIMSPWNYPFQLLMMPLIGAVSAGCCALAKPSPAAPATAEVMEKIISAAFQNRHIACVQGGKETGIHLLRERFDHIFFTGSTAMGKMVMKAAAEFLTPCTLELGGKSPCIVDASANLKVAAKRIAWGKGINSGQTCIAPDYLLVHSSVKQQFLKELAAAFDKLYGPEPRQSDYYGRMVSADAFDRVSGFLASGRVVFGGAVDKSSNYISPTVLDEVSWNDAVMQEEIFGPVLPVLPFDSLDEVVQLLAEKEKPLALYFFGGGKAAETVIRSTSSGGLCINDTLIQVAPHELPFGGIGNSGMGSYHGRKTFDIFTHEKAVVRTPAWLDLPARYPPFRGFRFFRRFLK